MWRIFLLLGISFLVMQCGSNGKKSLPPPSTISDDPRIPAGWDGLRDWPYSELEIQ